MLYFQGVKGDKGPIGVMGLKGHTGLKGDQVRQISFFSLLLISKTCYGANLKVYNVFPCVIKGPIGPVGPKGSQVGAGATSAWVSKDLSTFLQSFTRLSS